MLGIKSTREPIRGEFAVRLAQALQNAFEGLKRKNCVNLSETSDEYTVVWK